MSIKTKMGMAVSLLVIVMMSLGSMAAFSFFKKNFKQIIFHEQKIFLDVLANQIDDRLFEAIGNLDEVGDRVSSEIIADPERAQRFLDAQERLQEFFNGSLLLFSRDGRLIAGSPREINIRGKDYSFREYYRATVKTGRIYVSKPFLSQTRKPQPVIMITTPIFDRNQRLVAILAGSLQVQSQHYLKSLSLLRPRSNGFLSLYDGDRTVLVHPDPRRILVTDGPGKNRLLDKALAGFEGTEESVTRGGVPVLRSVKRLRSVDWIIALSYPVADAYAPIVQAGYYFVAGTAAAVLISGFLVWLMMDRLSAPLLLLTSHIRKISTAGKKPEVVHIERKDEIGTLAQSFNGLMGDLYDQKKELYDKVQLLEALMETVPVPTYYKDMLGYYIGCNKAFEELMSLPKESIIGRTVQELAPNGSALDFAGSCLASLSDGKVHVCETSVTIDGHGPRNLVFYRRCFQSAEAKTGGVVSSIVDLTERKQAEDRLRESEERFKTVVNNIPVGVAVIDTQMRVQSVNQQMAKWYPGIEPGSLPHCFQVFVDPPGEAACPSCPIEKTMSEEKVHQFMTERATAEGIRKFKMISSPIRDGAGKVVGATELVEDITEQRKLEEQLRQSQKMEAVGTLAGGIAHDFNNILTAIVGYLTLIETNTGEPDRILDYVGKVFEAAGRAAELTKGLLAYSRKQPHNPVTLDLNALVDKACQLISRLLGEDIELTVRHPKQKLKVKADGHQIEQILMNLATNARDAMPDGGTLEISVDPVDLGGDFVKEHGYGTPGSYVRLVVADSGDGMDRGTRERIFEPFFTTKGIGKGTGLGLAMVYGSVKQHGGFIGVASEAGRGTAFTIYLPQDSGDAVAQGIAEKPKPVRGSETLMLVEDEDGIRLSLKELLEQQGYRIIETGNPLEAVDLYRRHRESIDAVILDVIMPKKNGRAIYDEVKEISPGVKVLFMSGYTADILSAKGFSAGEAQFVGKPVEIGKLLASIRRLIEERDVAAGEVAEDLP